jgi:hypothetical protein
MSSSRKRSAAARAVQEAASPDVLVPGSDCIVTLFNGYGVDKSEHASLTGYIEVKTESATRMLQQQIDQGLIPTECGTTPDKVMDYCNRAPSSYDKLGYARLNVSIPRSHVPEFDKRFVGTSTKQMLVVVEFTTKKNLRFTFVAGTRDVAWKEVDTREQKVNELIERAIKLNDEDSSSLTP